MRTAVLGSGSWGTALAVLLGRKGHEVSLWGLPEEAEALARDRENVRYLPGTKLPDLVSPTSCLDEALSGCEAVVLAVPSTGVREVARKLKGRLSHNILLVNAGKGLESESGLRGSQVVTEELGPEIGADCVVLSGPNLAVELANGIPTATVVASSNPDKALAAQELFSAPNLRVYRNSDVVGVELGGALKNVMAIGAGVSDGLGYGDNTKATLVTRGVVEMIRLGSALGADPRTFTGLSGFGDLMATCASRLSRNLRLGIMLGEGKTLSESLQALGQVAEGMHTCKAAYLLSREHNIYMPITREVYAVLFESKSPRQAVADLMSRNHKEEF
ncbi:MAG: NAD(P)H-dependent glycerol-3-phosphate dehydrogenase [Armatimonadota bacterium]|nr:NAD(P)H-dependent glycerol-3-phosphate dehydrogenase [Armatimonadota bacterium]